MAQKDVWEREYRNPQLVAFGDDAQKDVRNFLSFLRKKEKKELSGLQVLDLGSGIGKNALHIARMGNDVKGIEISPTAVATAEQRAKDEGVNIEYKVRSIGEAFPFPDDTFDIVLDVMVSNSLNEAEREVYIQEVHRTLKKGEYFFVRALCKDGDKHAKALLAMNPGKEKDTYVNTDMGLVERVFSEGDFKAYYAQYFSFLDLFKKENYTRFNNRVYKRRYWCAYLQKGE